MRILVVDDVEQNRQLMQLRLSAEGHQVWTCVHGAQALEWLGAHACDLVLMDVQMPVMNGLDATRHIRAHEPEGEHLPIIALTASVLEDSVRETQDAGMDGFVVKPVSMAALNREMHKVLASVGAVASSGTSAVPIHASVKPAPDTLSLPGTPSTAISPSAADAWLDPDGLAGVDLAQALALWGQRDVWQRQATNFVAEALQDWPPARPHPLAADDRERLGAWAHRIRGAAGNLALVRVRELAAALEVEPESEAPWAQLYTQLTQLARALPSSLAHDDPVAMSARGAPAREDLLRLREHLRLGELVDELIQRVSAALAATPRQHLESALGDFDFERAQTLINQLLEVNDAA